MGEKLVILVPAYNEERSIGSLVLGAKKYGQVVVVDDCSSDRTAEIASAAGAAVLRHAQNKGYGSAMKTALAFAKKTNAAAFVLIDGDYQHDPSQIPAVAAPVLQKKADFCIGSRFLGKFVSPPPYRKEGVRFLNALSGASTDGRQLDFQCGFRAFSKKAAEKIRISSDGYSGCPEMLEAAISAGLKIAEVPVTVRYYEKKNGIGFLQGAGLFGRVMKAMAKRKPLLFFAGTGFALMVASALLGVFVVDTYYSKGVFPIGSAFLTVFTGVVGLVMISIGINLYTLEAVLEKKS